MCQCYLQRRRCIMMNGELREISQPNENIYEDTRKIGPYVIPLFLVVLAFFQGRVHHLWSESQILCELRRLKKRFTESELKNMLRNYTKCAQGSSDMYFSAVYIFLSNGGHHLLSRVIPHLYIICMTVLDSVNFWIYSPDVLQSDAIIGFRLLIAFGSLTVLKVHKITFIDIIMFALVVSGYTTLYCLGKTFTVPVVNKQFYRFSSIILALGVLIEIYSISMKYMGRGTGISDIVWTLHKEEPLKKGQMIRLKEMKSCTSCSSSTCIATPSLFKRYRLIIEELPFIIIAIIFLSESAVWVSQAPGKVRMAVVVQDIADFVSHYMLVINNTQVEPTLFVELMELANDEESEV